MFLWLLLSKWTWLLFTIWGTQRWYSSAFTSWRNFWKTCSLKHIICDCFCVWRWSYTVLAGPELKRLTCLCLPRTGIKDMCTTLVLKLAVATWWAFSQPPLTCCGMRCHWKQKPITKPVAEMDFTKAGTGMAFALNFLELFTSYLYMLYQTSPSFKQTIGQSSRINPQEFSRFRDINCSLYTVKDIFPFHSLWQVL